MQNNIFDNIESIIEIGASFEMVVTGYSMLPLLGYGRDRIILHRTTSDEDIMGRIAMFRSPSKHIIVHRVIAINGNVVTLQGDGNIYKQEECLRSEIIAVVDYVQRQNGKIVSCTDSCWRRREKIWLGQPLIVRRYALAVMRRWLNFKRKFR